MDVQQYFVAHFDLYLQFLCKSSVSLSLYHHSNTLGREWILRLDKMFLLKEASPLYRRHSILQFRMHTRVSSLRRLLILLRNPTKAMFSIVCAYKLSHAHVDVVVHPVSCYSWASPTLNGTAVQNPHDIYQLNYNIGIVLFCSDVCGNRSSEKGTDIYGTRALVVPWRVSGFWLRHWLAAYWSEVNHCRHNRF